ncbi:unnamed protein product [Haemonchus placei]|uniref:Uncharacterized protein n=1 Tax=Haemonchus placei TaxID=6290 RepID=A0A0N4WHE8_HAEPC|nr:unnamed protein product [Haemonchus placei]
MLTDALDSLPSGRGIVKGGEANRRRIQVTTVSGFCRIKAVAVFQIRPLDAFSCHSPPMLAQQIQLILLLICLFLLVLPSLACFGGGGGGGGSCCGVQACPSPCG